MSTAPTLRPYQEAMLDAIVTTLATGQNRILCKAPTGTGKTICFAAMLRWPGLVTWRAQFPTRGAAMLVIAHREELLNQAADKISKANPGLMVAVEQGERHASPYADVVIASVQTLSAMKFRRLHRLLRHHTFRLVIVDECFPAGTMVDGKPIEEVRVGDTVTAFNTETGQTSARRVLRVLNKRTDRLLVVTTDQGSLVCTPRHKVWTARGWVRAQALMMCDMIGHHATASHRQLPRLLYAGHADDEGAHRYVAPVEADLLLAGAPRPMVSRTVLRADGRHKPAAGGCADEGQEPDASPCGASQNADLVTREEASALDAWGKRPADPAPATGARVGARVACRGRAANGRRLQAPSLQTGYCESRPQDRDRGRWGQPRRGRSTKTGSAEGGVSAWARVDRIEVLESGGDGRFERVCPDGAVYDLEVEGLHTYFADGFAVSNCHHAAAASYRTALVHLGFLPPADVSERGDAEAATYDDLEKMQAALEGWDARAPKDRLLVGVTATPNRSDAIGLGCVFQTIAYSYALKDAIDDKYLVPIKPWVVETMDSLDAVRTIAGDFNQKDLADAVNNARRNTLAVAAWREHADGLSTIAFTVDVAHAHALAAEFRSVGVPAEAVSGETPKDDRRNILDRFRQGTLEVLSNCMVLTEGVDLPMARCILHAKPTKSATLYEQMCLDAETEILGEQGWIGIDDEITGKVAAFSLRDSEVCWSDATRIERPRGFENMWGIESPHLSLRVTGGHRMVTRQRGDRGWQIRFAEALPQEVKIPVCGTMRRSDADVTDDELTFLGLLLTDGHRNKTTNQITLFQSERYPEVMGLIRSTLRRLRLKFGHSVNRTPSQFGERSPLHRWTVSRGIPRGRDRHLRGWGWLKPWVSENAKTLTSMYEHLSRRQFGVLIAAMHAGDGVKSAVSWTRRTLSICGNHALCDQVQSLAVRLGYRCNKSWRTDHLAMLHISEDRCDWSIVSAAADGRPTWGLVPSRPDERVWCVSVFTGSIIIRRKGKVAVVGNTGRGLRLHPGKDECIVIDLVDVARRHSLQTAPVLYGLPPGLKTKGEDLKELSEGLEGLREKFPMFDLEAALAGGTYTLAQLAARASTFDVWTVPILAETIQQIVSMNWIATGANTYRLQYPWNDGTEILEVQPDMLGHFDLVATFKPHGAPGVKAPPARQRTLAAQVPDVLSALTLAEQYVEHERRQVIRLKDREAPWRQRPASPKQLSYLAKLRVPHTAAVLTMGQASDLIDLAQSRRVGGRR